MGTSGNLWQHYRDKPALNNAGDIIDVSANNNNDDDDNNNNNNNNNNNENNNNNDNNNNNNNNNNQPFLRLVIGRCP